MPERRAQSKSMRAAARVQSGWHASSWARTVNGATNGEIELPANRILVAAGTQPNTVLAREDAAHFALDGKYFRACDEDGKSGQARSGDFKTRPTCGCCSPSATMAVSSVTFGDVHPSFFGNVVKAMGSAKQGYPLISRVLAGKRAGIGA